jgi:hypothetical protein
LDTLQNCAYRKVGRNKRPEVQAFGVVPAAIADPSVTVPLPVVDVATPARLNNLAI